MFIATLRVAIFLLKLPIIIILDYIIGIILIVIYVLVSRHELLGNDQSEIETETQQLPEDVL